MFTLRKSSPLLLNLLQLWPLGIGQYYLDLLQMTGVSFWLKRSWRDRNPSRWIVAWGTCKTFQTAPQFTTCSHLPASWKLVVCWVGGVAGEGWFTQSSFPYPSSAAGEGKSRGKDGEHCLDDGWPSSRKLLPWQLRSVHLSSCISKTHIATTMENMF